jgi:hypothetical protein
MSIGHMLVQLGVSPAEFWHDARVFADGLVKLRALYDFDGILVSLHGHDPDWRSSITSRERNQEGERIVWDNGDSTFYPNDDLPIHSSLQNSTAGDPIEGMLGKLPESLDYIPVSQGLHFNISPRHRFDVFDFVREMAGSEYSIHGEVTSPFDYYLDLVGYQEGLMMLIDSPEQARRILSHFSRLVSSLAIDMCKKGIDAVKISSPFAGAGFISPAFYEEFVVPCERSLAMAVRSLGVHVYTHTCGAIDDRLELMFESGISGIECLDPPPLGNVELDDAMLRIGNKGFVKGNIDSVNILLMGTRDQIQADAKKRIETGKQYGGFILSTACSIAPHVNRENICLLREAVDRWG